MLRRGQRAIFNSLLQHALQGAGLRQIDSAAARKGLRQRIEHGLLRLLRSQARPLQQRTARGQGVGHLNGGGLHLDGQGFFSGAAVQGCFEWIKRRQVHLGYAQSTKQQVFCLFKALATFDQLLHQVGQRCDHRGTYRSLERGGVGLARADHGATRGHHGALRGVFGEQEVACGIGLDADFARIELAVVIAVNEHGGVCNVAIDHCALHLAFDEGPYQIGNGRQRGAVIVLIRADAIQPFARDVGDGGAEKVVRASSNVQLLREGVGRVNALVQRGGVFAQRVAGNGQCHGSGGDLAAVQLTQPVLLARRLGHAAQHVQVDGIDQLGIGFVAVQRLRFGRGGKALGNGTPVALVGNGLVDPVVQPSGVGRATKVGDVHFLHAIDQVALHLVDQRGELRLGGAG